MSTPSSHSNDIDRPSGLGSGPTDTSTLWQSFFRTALGALMPSSGGLSRSLVVDDAAAWADAAVAEVLRREALVVERRGV